MAGADVLWATAHRGSRPNLRAERCLAGPVWVAVIWLSANGSQMSAETAQVDRTGTMTTVTEHPDRFTIEIHRKTVGLADYHNRDDGCRGFSHTEVLPEYRGRGLATILIAKALRSTRAAGYGSCRRAGWWPITSRNTRSIRTSPISGGIAVACRRRCSVTTPRPLEL